MFTFFQIWSNYLDTPSPFTYIPATPKASSCQIIGSSIFIAVVTGTYNQILKEGKMRKRLGKSVGIVVAVMFFLVSFTNIAPAAEKPIVIGAPLATAFLYGWDADRKSVV